MTELSKLSIEELQSLQHRAVAEIAARQSADLIKNQKEVQALADRLGIEIKIVGGTATAKPGKGKRAAVAAKYRNPLNSAQTWTGRGRSPTWVAEWKATHGSLDGVTIK